MNTRAIYLLIACLSFVLGKHPLELRGGRPSGWIQSDLHKRDNLGGQEMQVTIALSQRNTDLLEDRFWAVSSPTNPQYGNYMSFEDVISIVSPSQASIDQVYSYFTANGISQNKIELHQSRDFVTVAMSVEQAETLFQTSYEPYHHKRTGAVGVGMRDRAYKLHDELDLHVDFITSFSRLPNAPRVVLPPRSTNQRSSTSRAVQYNPDLNAPVILAGGNNASAYVGFLIVCPDGSGPALSGSTISCGSITVSQIVMTFISNVTGQTIFGGNAFPFNLFQFGKCSSPDYISFCEPIAIYSNYSTEAVLGEITVPNLPNLTPYYITIQLTYSNAVVGQLGKSSVIINDEGFSPQTFSSLYGVPLNLNSTSPRNSQAVAAFEGQSVNISDVKAYFQKFNINDFTNLINIVHPENNDQTNPGAEATLDVEGIMSNARNCTTYFWAQNDTRSTIDDHLTWILDVLNSANPPLVNSVSYGNAEIEYTVDYMTRTNIEFMKAGVRGLTLIYASGDFGAFSDNFYNRTAFTPSYPASSPYVTSVGATQIFTKSNSACFSGTTYTCPVEEIVCSIATGASITSGGGFSDYFPRPSYQNTAVSGYLSRLGSLQGFNASNRAFPDVSMNGHNCGILLGGQFFPVDGTSASAPFFAAFVTLMNDIRLLAGNSPLGFLNPLIYAFNSSHFNDITRGDNNCTELGCRSTGYPATPGYDAVTGFGSPIYSVWASSVANLPPNYNSSTSSSTSSATSSSPSTSSAPSSTTSSSATTSPSTSSSTSPSSTSTSTSSAPTSSTSSTSSSPSTTSSATSPSASLAILGLIAWVSVLF